MFNGHLCKNVNANLKTPPNLICSTLNCKTVRRFTTWRYPINTTLSLRYIHNYVVSMKHRGKEKRGGVKVEEKGKIDRKVEKDKSAITNKNVVIKVKLERKVRNMCV